MNQQIHSSFNNTHVLHIYIYIYIYIQIVCVFILKNQIIRIRIKTINEIFIIIKLIT